MADTPKRPNVSLPPAVETPTKPDLSALLEQCWKAAMAYPSSTALAQFLSGLAVAKAAIPDILAEGNDQ